MTKEELKDKLFEVFKLFLSIEHYLWINKEIDFDSSWTMTREVDVERIAIPEYVYSFIIDNELQNFELKIYNSAQSIITEKILYQLTLFIDREIENDFLTINNNQVINMNQNIDFWIIHLQKIENEFIRLKLKYC